MLEKQNIEAGKMYERWAKEDVAWEEFMLDDAEFVCMAYGMSARVCKYAITELRKEGIKIGLIRPKTLYPFPKQVLRDLDYDRVKAIIDVEMALPCQMVDDIELQVKERIPVLQYGHSGGVTLKNEESTAALRALIGGFNG